MKFFKQLFKNNYVKLREALLEQNFMLYDLIQTQISENDEIALEIYDNNKKMLEANIDALIITIDHLLNKKHLNIKYKEYNQYLSHEKTYLPRECRGIMIEPRGQDHLDNSLVNFYDNKTNIKICPIIKEFYKRIKLSNYLKPAVKYLYMKKFLIQINFVFKENGVNINITVSNLYHINNLNLLLFLKKINSENHYKCAYIAPIKIWKFLEMCDDPYLIIFKGE